MRALSLFFLAGGVLSLFGSVVSLGLTFLDQFRGGSWAPTRTGAFLMHYLGVDFGSLSVFQMAGAQQVVSFVLDEQLYKAAFVLGVVMLFGAMVTRGVQER